MNMKMRVNGVKATPIVWTRHSWGHRVFLHFPTSDSMPISPHRALMMLSLSWWSVRSWPVFLGYANHGAPLFARHNTQQFHIQGRARGVDIPSRCSEEIVDAAIVSARLITLHPNAEPSSITWIKAQIKTFDSPQWHLNALCTAYARRVLISIAVQIPVLITVTAA